jgi:hypothetical protein
VNPDPDYANMWPDLKKARWAQQRPQCNKVTHPDKNAAKHARKVALASGRVPGGLRIYFCHPCKGWHLSKT